MDERQPKKPITLDTLAESLDGLAKQMAEGFKMSDKRFESIDGRFESIDRNFEDLNNRIANGFADIQTQITNLFNELQKVKIDMEGLRSSVNNYLKLSDEHYLELKHRQDVLTRWVTKIAEQNKVDIDIKELEYK